VDACLILTSWLECGRESNNCCVVWDSCTGGRDFLVCNAKVCAPFIKKMHLVNRELTKTTSDCLVQEEFLELGGISISAFSSLTLLVAFFDLCQFRKSKSRREKSQVENFKSCAIFKSHKSSQVEKSDKSETKKYEFEIFVSTLRLLLE